MRDTLRGWRSRNSATPTAPEQQLLEANRNLRQLLEDTSIPSTVREALAPEFADIERLSRKLRDEEIHIAAFGRVGAGKSSLLNALLGQAVFSTSPLHGETRDSQQSAWSEFTSAHVVLIDTPGIDELHGEERETLAREVAERADILLMVCEGDLTDSESRALDVLAGRQRPLLLVLNKSDRYTPTERELLLERLVQRTGQWLPADRILAAAADPRPETVIVQREDGSETETQRPRSPDIGELQTRLWQVLEAEGKTLAALNAALFASELDARVAQRIVEARRELATKIIRNYCIGKGVAVAVNPVPVADLLAAAGVDVAMVIHLGQVYGHSLSRREAAKLLVTIAAQMAALMGAYWGVNLVSSALKGVSAGLSTVLTGSAQGALAWYATLVIGRAAESWFALGKTWGADGPRETVRSILDGLDRDSIMAGAREDIAAMLKRPAQSQ